MEQRSQWIANAERIATGLLELAHLPAFVDPRCYRVGFFCEGDIHLAGEYVRHIRAENVESRRGSAPVPDKTVGMKQGMPVSAPPADEVVLPCRPDSTDEEIVHAVLATMKASHALEFEIAVDKGA